MAKRKTKISSSSAGIFIDGLPGDSGNHTCFPQADEMVPISEYQMGIFHYQMLNPEGLAYNLCVDMRVDRAIGKGNLKRAVKSFFGKHPELRKQYNLSEEGVVESEIADLYDPFEWNCANCYSPSSDRDILSTPYRMNEGRLFRCEIEEGSVDLVLRLGIHHICWDMTCFEIITKGIESEYRTLLSGSQSVRDENNDIRALNSTIRQNTESADDPAYWRSFVKPLPELHAIEPSAVCELLGASSTVSYVGSQAESKNIANLAKSIGTTEYSLVSTISAISLCLALGKLSCVLASTVSMRDRESEFEKLEYCANTLPVAISLAPELSIIDLALEVFGRLSETFQHCNVSFGNIVQLRDLAPAIMSIIFST